MNKIWQQFRPAYLLTWPVFFTTYIWSLLVHFTDSIINGPGFLLKRLIVISGLQLLVFFLIYLKFFLAKKINTVKGRIVG